MCKIIKRNGELQDFNIDKIIAAAEKAFKSVSESMPEEVLNDLKQINPGDENLQVEEIQDMIENILFKHGCQAAYKNFTGYRSNHALLREARDKAIFKSIINTEKNDVTRDNGNMNSDTPAGMMMKFASETSKQFVDKCLISKDILKEIDNNYLYIHDKDYYPSRSLTCLQHPLDRILSKGFMAGHGEARPAKRIETAAILAAISMETIQNEMHGGQAIPAFDFYMAPYVRMTYEEEVEKLAKIINKGGESFWNDIKNAKIDDYIVKDINSSHTKHSKIRYKQIAINNTVGRVHQAMESFIHNMNSIHSRGGNQVVFSSINYGTDTSAEGRCIIRELLLSTERGVGHNATAIFPIQIWKLKKGVSRYPGDKNYDLYKLSQRVSARRFFPNYLNLDSTFNSDALWKKTDPHRYEHEVATMGCRTRVYENRFGDKTSIGRGNLSFTTINLPKIAIEVAIEDGFLKKTDTGYEINNITTESDNNRRCHKFIKILKEKIDLAGRQLDERYQFQRKALAKQFPLLMSGMWNGSEKLNSNDEVGDIINQGTLGVGFIGLAEALIALTGKHHGESDESQQMGLHIIQFMKQCVDILSTKYNHNYSVLATPAEGLSGRFTKEDQKTFGVIKGITDKDYYTNSNHIPVYYKCTPSHKAEIECPYHKLTLGGHIFYVEADADITKNPDVIGEIVEIACNNNAGYISINHTQGRCNYCNYESNDPTLVEGGKCPNCGHEHSWDVLQRITGYLVGTLDRWGSGKLAELKDRVVHT